MKRLVVLVIAVVIAAIAIAIALRQTSSPKLGQTSANAEQGQYLVRAGNCFGCHTVQGGQPYAGGRAIPTPFGTLYSTNITPDANTGIGKWSADDFWRALHEGKSKDGSLLYPAFPYTSYTRVTREDADAMYAHLKTIPAVSQQNRAHEMRFPYDKRPLLAGWRALYFNQGTFKPDAKQSDEWNRGAYLVQGLGHCGACHAERGPLGGIDERDVGGGLIPMLNWYAPALGSKREIDDIVEFLKSGVSPRRAAFGPMAEVVRHSLQHLTQSDLRAIAAYLRSQPPEDDDREARSRMTAPQKAQLMKQGARVYRDRCSDCHQANGEGAPRAYPPLAGNEAILMRNPVNAIRITLNGGFPPSTQGNPRPYGMPPFAHVLSDGDVAAVVTYIRGAWGNAAGAVSSVEVASARGVPLD